MPSSITPICRAACVLLSLTLLDGCTSDADCGEQGGEPSTVPAPVNWSDVHRRAQVVFDVTCTQISDEDLQTKYRTGVIQAEVRVLPMGTRYLLRFDHALLVQEIYLPGTNMAILDEILAGLDRRSTYDEQLGATFHRGFLGTAKGVHADVSPLLQRDFATRLTGYSLGGATAVILALQLEHDGFHVDSILTFGQPKVTDADGADKLSNQPLLRIKCGNDGITHIFAPEYRHYGDQIILLDNDRFVYLTPDEANYDVSTDPDVQGVDLADHLVYLARVLPKLERATPTSFCEAGRFITPGEGSVCE